MPLRTRASRLAEKKKGVTKKKLPTKKPLKPEKVKNDNAYRDEYIIPDGSGSGYNLLGAKTYDIPEGDIKVTVLRNSTGGIRFEISNNKFCCTLKFGTSIRNLSGSMSEYLEWFKDNVIPHLKTLSRKYDESNPKTTKTRKKANQDYRKKMGRAVWGEGHESGDNSEQE